MRKATHHKYATIALDALQGALTLAIAGFLVVSLILALPRYIAALDGRSGHQETITETVR